MTRHTGALGRPFHLRHSRAGGGRHGHAPVARHRNDRRVRDPRPISDPTATLRAHSAGVCGSACASVALSCGPRAYSLWDPVVRLAASDQVSTARLPCLVARRPHRDQASQPARQAAPAPVAASPKLLAYALLRCRRFLDFSTAQAELLRQAEAKCTAKTAQRGPRPDHAVFWPHARLALVTPVARSRFSQRNAWSSPSLTPA